MTVGGKKEDKKQKKKQKRPAIVIKVAFLM